LKYRMQRTTAFKLVTNALRQRPEEQADEWVSIEITKERKGPAPLHDGNKYVQSKWILTPFTHGIDQFDDRLAP
jgi:hypothetical protein